VIKVDQEPIRKAYRWLYVVFGVRFGRWFLQNSGIQEKKEDVFLQHMEEILAVQSAKKVKVLYNTTRTLLEQAIRAGLDLANEGASIDRIQAAIRQNITGVGGAISEGRARTIARTEVISSANQSSYEAVRATGLQVEKAWITGGANIRATHLEAADQGWIAQNDKFIVGGHMMDFPGDPEVNAPEEVINCKCTIIYRTI
jgi:hypothetical protein